MTADVIVVGGGVIGCAAAHALAGRGARVRLIEREAIAAQASSAAAGMLAPLAESRGQGPLFTLGTAALRGFPGLVREIEEQSGIDVQLSLRGLVHVFRDLESATEHAAALERRAAAKLERWDTRVLRRELPELADDRLAGVFSPGEGVVDPARLTRAFAVAAERSGVELQTGMPVIGLLERRGRVAGVVTPRESIEADEVVWCAGAWGAQLRELTGLPVYPVKGQMLALESRAWAAGPLVWDSGVYLVPRRDGVIRIGATTEDAGFDTSPSARGVHSLLARAFEVAPALANARFVRTWAGLRPGTPDGLPLVGRQAGRPGLTLAVGHGRHGILLSGLTAAWVASEVLGTELAFGGARAAELRAPAPSAGAGAESVLAPDRFRGTG